MWGVQYTRDRVDGREDCCLGFLRRVCNKHSCGFLWLKQWWLCFLCPCLCYFRCWFLVYECFSQSTRSTSQEKPERHPAEDRWSSGNGKERDKERETSGNRDIQQKIADQAAKKEKQAGNQRGKESIKAYAEKRIVLNILEQRNVDYATERVVSNDGMVQRMPVVVWCPQPLPIQ